MCQMPQNHLTILNHVVTVAYYFTGFISPLSLLLQAYLIYSSSVAAGAQSGIEECKYQFAWDRWNCPERALQLSTHSSLRSGESRGFNTSSDIFTQQLDRERPQFSNSVLLFVSVLSLKGEVFIPL